MSSKPGDAGTDQCVGGSTVRGQYVSHVGNGLQGLLIRLTAIIERERDGYVSLCPELDIASQGDSVEQARENLREALELFFECASAQEVQRRLRSEVYVTQVEVAIGEAPTRAA